MSIVLAGCATVGMMRRGIPSQLGVATLDEWFNIELIGPCMCKDGRPGCYLDDNRAAECTKDQAFDDTRKRLVELLGAGSVKTHRQTGVEQKEMPYQDLVDAAARGRLEIRGTLHATLWLTSRDYFTIRGGGWYTASVCFDPATGQSRSCDESASRDPLFFATVEVGSTDAQRLDWIRRDEDGTGDLYIVVPFTHYIRPLRVPRESHNYIHSVNFAAKMHLRTVGGSPEVLTLRYKPFRHELAFLGPDDRNGTLSKVGGINACLRLEGKDDGARPVDLRSRGLLATYEDTSGVPPVSFEIPWPEGHGRGYCY